ncbi:MAG: bifunctional phosphopantothenoylcysteine decarboxylase/phosphopantothenate--cysteine ligase CoaBC [Bacteroidota bacterium]
MTPLTGKKILITAGPTYEPIDPVRFIGNRSSGKMGYALADQLASMGAIVTLISGPVRIKCTQQNIHLIRVETAAQMYNACCDHFTEQIDIGIYAAAVADYTPKEVSNSKIKKNDEELQLTLVKTKDILKEMGQRKKDHQVLVGFALETDEEEYHAQQKLIKKNLDFIVLNSLKDVGAGFAVDTNKITILDKYNKITKFELKAKTAVAIDIIDYLIPFIHA